MQMIQRLKEVRELLIVLAIIERSLVIEGFRFPGDDDLQAMDADLPYQPEIKRALYRLSNEQRVSLLELFNTDRDPALDLVSFMDMMLGLFQEADSSLDGSVLAFYQQREWRLIHHMRQGMTWHCLTQTEDRLGDRSELPLQDTIRELRFALSAFTGKRFDESYYRRCWLLQAVDGRPIADYVVRAIAPARAVRKLQLMMHEAGCSAEVIPAEDMGYGETHT